jgi:surfeit locus 1 family protein
MPAGYSFRPRVWALALAALACAAGVALGNWQMRRAEEKLALGARVEAALRGPALELSPLPVEAAQLVLKRVSARGEFVPRHTVLLANKLRGGRPGYEAVTPLRLGGGTLHVLVNRGWIEAGASPESLPDVRTPPGTVRLEGLALERLPRVLEPGASQARGRARLNLDVAQFAAETGLALHPLVIEQLSELDDGLARVRPRTDFGAAKNEMYALQWYSLAALAVVLVIVLSFRRDGPASR